MGSLERQSALREPRTTSLMMSRALSDACSLTGDILQPLDVLLEGMQVFPERMRRNLDLSGGLIMAEAVMLHLGVTIGRQRAHDIVYDAAQAAATTGRSFRELLTEDETIRTRVSPAEIDALLDPEHYTGLPARFALDGAARARAVAAEIDARGIGLASVDR